MWSAHPPAPSRARAACIPVCSAARIAHALSLSARWWGKGALVKRNGGGVRLFLTIQSHKSGVGGEREGETEQAELLFVSSYGS